MLVKTLWKEYHVVEIPVFFAQLQHCTVTLQLNCGITVQQKGLLQLEAEWGGVANFAIHVIIPYVAQFPHKFEILRQFLSMETSKY